MDVASTCKDGFAPMLRLPVGAFRYLYRYDRVAACDRPDNVFSKDRGIGSASPNIVVGVTEARFARLQAALTGMSGIDDAWIADLGRVVLDGARPARVARRGRPNTSAWRGSSARSGIPDDERDPYR
jgi:hypothetical protein